MIEQGWNELFKEEFVKDYFISLTNFLEKEKAEGWTVCPGEADIFNAFEKTSFEKVKVVIVGQDPYHGVGQAHGLAFSVKEGSKIPPSLKNIYKELQGDLGISCWSTGSLEKWAERGVLLLNSILTVRQGAPMSHHGCGWERFTDAVILKLTARKDPLVFLLWGKAAAKKCDHLLGKIDHPHLVLIAAHPSPYSASRGFLGCRHFSKTNEALKKWGKGSIDWGT